MANLLEVMSEYDIIEAVVNECDGDCGGGGGCPCTYTGAYTLTDDKGLIAVSIAETNPVLMALVCTKWNYFEEFTPPELAAFFSIFTDARVNQDWSDHEMLSDKLKSFDEIRFSLLGAQEARKIYVT